MPMTNHRLSFEVYFYLLSKLMISLSLASLPPSVAARQRRRWGGAGLLGAVVRVPGAFCAHPNRRLQKT